jgi:hypothetical protein
MILGWPSSKFASDDPDFHPKWPPKLKIERRGIKFKKNLLL